MPDDVPLAKRPDAVSEHAWLRFFRYWEWFFAVATAAVTALLWFSAGSVGAGAQASLWMVALVVWYLALGRRLIVTELGGRLVYLYLAGVVALFVPLALVSDVALLMLFPLVSHVFWLDPLRAAIVTVVALNFVPALRNAIDGADAVDLLASAAVGAVTAMASIAIGVFIHRIVDQSFERSRLIEELESSRAEVARLSRAAGAAAERERLGAELHDTVTQGLSSIVMLSQACRTAAGDQREEHLRLIEETARANLSEARAMVEAMHPDETAAVEIGSALAELAEAAGAALEVRGESRRLPPSTSVVVVRAVQEVLRNIDKHAAGASARLRLDYGDDAVSVAVTDDGPGFDHEAPTAGFGLRGTRNRVVGLGGRFEVDSAPGRGATVRLEVPA